jgi:lipoprotein-anchoring transpeptidase ErfK/SrfK
MWNPVVVLVGLAVLFGPTSHMATEVYPHTLPPLPRSLAQAARAAEEEMRLEISLSQRRVTLYRGTSSIKTYPIAIGRAGWETPTGTFAVRQMQENPVWIHPFTNERISNRDPRNPLGSRWIGFWTDGHNWIGFHGTTDTASVGRAVSHGCIRMHNADIEALFSQIDIGTPVTVVP